MGIMELSDSAHTAAATAMEKLSFLVLSFSIAVAMWMSHNSC